MVLQSFGHHSIKALHPNIALLCIVPAWRPNICRHVFNGQRACNFAEKKWSRQRRLPVCLCQGSGLWLWYFSLILHARRISLQSKSLSRGSNVKANGFFHVMVSFWKLFHHSCDVNPFVFYDVGIFQISFLQLFARKRQARNEATRVGHLLWWFVVVISVVVDDLRLMVDSCLIVSFFWECVLMHRVPQLFLVAGFGLV